MTTSDDEKYYRQPWMSDDQWSCAQLFADAVGGFHRVTGKFRSHGLGISISSRSSWATWDGSRLTGLVVMAHDRMVRVEIIPSGPGMVGFALWQRHSREGGIAVRIPTIEEAIAWHRPRAILSATQEATVCSADMISYGANTTRGVFSNTCGRAVQAIDYMENLLLSLSTITSGKGGEP